MGRTYHETDGFIYKNIEQDSDKKVVFLSGLGLEIYKQREGFIRRFVLNAGVSYLALDYTNYIYSSYGKKGFSLNDVFPKTLETLAKTSKGEKLFLCGLCFGGTMALKLASQFPDRIGGVIVSSPACETPDFPWINQADTFLSGRIHRLKSRQSEKKMIAKMILFRRIVIQAFKEIGRERLETSYQGPLYLFHGQTDHLIPAENSVHIRQALQNENAQLHILPQTGHSIGSDFQMKKPLAFLKELLADEKLNSRA